MKRALIFLLFLASGAASAQESLSPFAAIPLDTPPSDTTNITTTISNVGGYNSSATSIVVASSSGFSATPFLASWESEDVKVTAVSGTTWTITRGYNSTTAASHADGTTLTQLNWEWVNQGGIATTTTLSTGAIVLATPGATGLNMRIRKRLMGSNTSFRVGFVTNIVTTNSQVIGCGLVLRESATGKLANFEIRPGSSNQLFIQHWSSPTAATANDLANAFIGFYQEQLFYRADLSGSNILYFTSAEGRNWNQILSIAKTTQFTTAPDEWGFMCWTNASTGVVNSAALTLNLLREQP
jgi:hypothetical protein